MFSDNFSRRKTLIVFMALTDIGFLLLVTSSSMTMAIIGLFLINFGCSPIYRTLQVIISEITEPVLKQKFIGSLMGALSVGTLLSGVLYPAIKHWRFSSLYCGLIPSIIITVLILIFLEDTPKFILRNGSAAKAAKIFNRIAAINNQPS